MILNEIVAYIVLEQQTKSRKGNPTEKWHQGYPQWNQTSTYIGIIFLILK